MHQLMLRAHVNSISGLKTQDVWVKAKARTERISEDNVKKITNQPSKSITGNSSNKCLVCIKPAFNYKTIQAATVVQLSDKLKRFEFSNSILNNQIFKKKNIGGNNYKGYTATNME